MTRKIPPKDGFIATLTRVPREGETRWMDANGKRLYTWDGVHGELEVFTSRGHHLGSVDPVTGKMLKDAVKGRKIDV
ncbi:MAG: hypothetical protein IT377_19915 [Polyangiaceae bacterium]|nr:hypothetical protein [Polyangiaceae bacterium]